MWMTCGRKMDVPRHLKNITRFCLISWSETGLGIVPAIKRKKVKSQEESSNKSEVWKTFKEMISRGGKLPSAQGQLSLLLLSENDGSGGFLGLNGWVVCPLKTLIAVISWTDLQHSEYKNTCVHKSFYLYFSRLLVKMKTIFRYC